ncbi:MAG: hypothetical protein E7591_06580 [Ruminococcaceae bacterium]|nr:hypothetical protein [Oscillospiraceae bacterium]
MKRKALITSTALLLVALMCLATASYAWFTAGTASAVTDFQVSITAGDTGLYIAAADMTGSAPTFAPDFFTKEDAGITSQLAANGFVSSTLKPVSTNGKFDAAKTIKFFEAPADTFDGTYWDVNAVNAANTDSNPGYVLFSFYVKATGVENETTYNVNFDGTIFDDPASKAALKLAYQVTDVTVTDGEVVTTKPDKNLTIYTFGTATDYDPIMVAGGEDSITKDGKNFVAADGKNILDTSDDLVENAWVEPTLTFAKGDSAKLVTVAMWLEGQDPDCSGTFKIEDKTLAISLS